MQLRRYRDGDAAATRGVFEKAVRVTAARDYTPAQIRAWVGPDLDANGLSEWAAARASAYTLVAVEDDAVIGFADLVGETLLDMLYVDPGSGHRGVGSALISQIVAVARSGRARVVEVHASLTARPVFERHGFVVVAQRTPVVRGVATTNFQMRLMLDGD